MIIVEKDAVAHENANEKRCSGTRKKTDEITKRCSGTQKKQAKLHVKMQSGMLKTS